MNSAAPPRTNDFARFIVDVASDKLASDIVMLDLRDVSDFTDYFIVVTVESSRQMDGLRDDLESAAEENGGKLHHREGTSNGGWVLLDFIDVIVHLFNPDSRDYYQIEQAWPDAIETVRIQ